MLTLTGFRDISHCRVFRDDVDPLTQYVIPFTPRVALDDQGKPIISLVVYRRDVSKLSDEERKTRLGGGILTMSAELSVTPEQEAAIRKSIASDPALKQLLARAMPQWWMNEARQDEKKLAAALKVNMVPVKDGTVEIAIVGEAPDAAHPGEFVASLIGAGRVSMLGNMRASFMAKLTLEGSVLLWEMLEKNLPGVRVAYDLKFDHRLDAVKMVVWADAKKAYDAVQEMWQHLQENASFSTRTSGNTTVMTAGHDQSNEAGEKLRIVAEASQASSVTITQEGDSKAVSQDVIANLTKVGNDMISQFLASTILDYKPGQDAKFSDQPDLKTELPDYQGKPYGHHGVDFYNLKTWHDEMRATLSNVFTSKAVLEGSLGPNDNLANILAGQKADAFRTQIDLNAAWYQYIDVQIACTTNFDEDPVDLVEAHLSYKATGAQGQINSAKDYIFKKDSAVQRFSTYLAAPDKRAYDYQYKVYYKGTNKTMTVNGKTEDTVLILDTDRLGILRVNVDVGLIDWDRIKTALLRLSYGSGAALKQMDFTLNSQNQKQTWNEVIGAPVNDPYRYQVTFIDKDNHRIETPEQTATSKQLIINQPLQENLEVAVIPAGEFGAEGLISKIAVALRYTDKPNNYRSEQIIILDDSKKTQTWDVPVVNPKLRSYDYQTTVFYSDGVTRTDEWRSSDSTVLAVGDPFGFRVQINPRLVKSPPFSFGTIHLRFDDDAAQIHSEKTLEIPDFTRTLFWRFRLGAPDRHTYRYQVTLFKDDGTQVDFPEQTATQEVLVLKPVLTATSAPTS